MLACDSPSTAVIYNALRAVADVAAVVVEDTVPRREVFQRRAKAFGWASGIGQALFALLLRRPLERSARERIGQIQREAGLDLQPPPAPLVQRVASVNSPACRRLLRQLAPQVVVVNGTRLIGRRTLHSVPAPFINIHPGITPRYRGYHGGYWALVDGHPEWCGTTVHFIDEGIDTGDVIGQAVVRPQAADNLATYPWLQLAAGLPLLQQAVRGCLAGAVVRSAPLCQAASRLWSGPTLWGYWWARLTRGVK
jgi:hypothetical protein